MKTHVSNDDNLMEISINPSNTQNYNNGIPSTPHQSSIKNVEEPKQNVDVEGEVNFGNWMLEITRRRRFHPVIIDKVLLLDQNCMEFGPIVPSQKKSDKFWSSICLFDEVLSCVNDHNTKSVTKMFSEHAVHSSTIDPKEYVIFNSISSVWWDPKGEIRALHQISNLMTPFILKEVINAGLPKKEFVNSTTPLKGLEILEVGCGGGLLSEKIAKLGCNMTGIDINPQLIEVAKHHATLDSSLINLNYQLEAVEDHALNHPKKYDVVVANFVLEHVYEQELFLRTCIKCLRAGGSLITSSIGQTWMGWFFGIIVPEFILKKIPAGMHEWDKFINIEQTEQILDKYKCRTTSRRGLCYSMLSEHWNWIDSTSMFYALHAVKSHY
ncbi:hypothetical protein FQR65_LT09084 [Abscondita terminalis]|nr:hypothetical protein FQR65_LT09084 [Abscondita terminalis]